MESLPLVILFVTVLVLTGCESRYSPYCGQNICGVHEMCVSDFNLVRWLENASDNVEIAESHLRDHLRFRRLHYFDDNDFLLPKHDLMHQYYPTKTLESENAVIHISMEGRMDISGLFYSLSAKDFLLSRLVDAELVLRKVMQKEAETGCRQYCTVLIDMKGAKYDTYMWKALKEVLPTLHHTLSSNYAGLIKHIVVINGGKMFDSAWSLIGQYFRKQSDWSKIIKILSSDWSTEISQYIAPENLPEFYHGFAEDDDFSYSYAPLTIPRSNYYNPRTDPVDELALKYMVLSAKSSENVSVYCSTTAGQGCKMCWYLKSDGVFEFSIFFSEEEIDSSTRLIPADSPGSIELLVPHMEVWCNYVPEIGAVQCAKVGWYHVQFINKDNMMSRSVKLRVHIADN